LVISPFDFLNPQFDILRFLAPIITNTQVRNAVIIARLLTGNMGYKGKNYRNTFFNILRRGAVLLSYSSEAIIFTASNPSILKRVSHIPHTALPLESSLAEISSFRYSHFGQRKEKLTTKLSSSIVSPIVYQYEQFNIFRVT